MMQPSDTVAERQCHVAASRKTLFVSAPAPQGEFMRPSEPNSFFLHFRQPTQLFLAFARISRVRLNPFEIASFSGTCVGPSDFARTREWATYRVAGARVRVLDRIGSPSESRWRHCPLKPSNYTNSCSLSRKQLNKFVSNSISHFRFFVFNDMICEVLAYDGLYCAFLGSPDRRCIGSRRSRPTPESSREKNALPGAL